MSVEINPAQQLGFHRPLTQLVKRTLTVINPNPQPVAFKVKTTAPKQYCVRPNSGRIEPGERVEVQVLLQPMKEDPEPGAKCRDKFLVQSAVITPEREDRPLPELWSMIEKEDKSSISEHKIRCAYLPPVETPEVDSSSSSHINGTAGAASALGAAAAGLGAAGVASTLARDDDDQDAKYNTVRSTMNRAPSPANQPAPAISRDHTPATTNTTSTTTTTSADPITTSSPPPAVSVAPPTASSPASKEDTSSSSAKPSSNTSSATTAGSSAPAAAPNGAAVLPKVHEESKQTLELEKKLAEAEREITRLKAQLKEAESGLRQRNVPVAAGSLGQQTQQVVKGEAGVPMQTVAMIVAGTFVFTWLFF